ncbi:replication initiator protein A [Fusobacterium polymorphum]|uniref:replication initiator protein A n=1 Tax=Fusobacterium nucleatum subsp. polymorphum TaxID=76857 RepID=UPI0030CE5945
MEEKEPYFQVPKSLFRSWREGKINSTAFSIYMLMLDRYKVSKKNKWKDEEGNFYIIYSYEELLENLCIKNKNILADALKELEKLNLLKKRKRYRNSTIFYLKSESNQNVTSTKNESNVNDTLTQSESNQNVTTRSNQNVTFILEKNTQKDIGNKEEIESEITPNKNNYNKNNINNSKNNNVIDPALKNEIHLLLRGRNIKANQITKICIDIQRIKEVIEYADSKELGNGFIIKALKENWRLGLDIQASSEKSGLDIQADKNNSLGLDIQANTKNSEIQREKDYSMSIDEALKRSRNKR